MDRRNTRQVEKVMADAQQQFMRSRAVVARRVGGEIVLVRTGLQSVAPQARTAELFVLNRTGERLWDALEAPCTLDGLARNLIAEYGIEYKAALADAEAFIAELRQADILNVVATTDTNDSNDTDE